MGLSRNLVKHIPIFKFFRDQNDHLISYNNHALILPLRSKNNSLVDHCIYSLSGFEENLQIAKVTVTTREYTLSET